MLKRTYWPEVYKHIIQHTETDNRIEVKLSTDFVTLNFDLSLPPFKKIDINYLNALKYIQIIPGWIASTRSHTWNKKYYANSEIRRKKRFGEYQGLELEDGTKKPHCGKPI